DWSRPHPDPDLREPGAARLAGLEVARLRDLVRPAAGRDRHDRGPRQLRGTGRVGASVVRAAEAALRSQVAGAVRRVIVQAVSASTSSFRTSIPRSVGTNAPSRSRSRPLSTNGAAFSGSTHDVGTPSRIRRRRNTSSRQGALGSGGSPPPPGGGPP